ILICVLQYFCSIGTAIRKKHALETRQSWVCKVGENVPHRVATGNSPREGDPADECAVQRQHRAHCYLLGLPVGGHSKVEVEHFPAPYLLDWRVHAACASNIEGDRNLISKRHFTQALARPCILACALGSTCGSKSFAPMPFRMHKHLHQLALSGAKLGGT